MEDPVETHTSEVQRNQEAAEKVMERMKKRGWSVYHEHVPLQGQSGYYCVRTTHSKDGEEIRQAHSVRWNIFGSPLEPVTIDCTSQQILLSFIWKHAGHDGFEYFEYGDGDLGLVCYCRAHKGYSLVLQMSDDFDHDLDDECYELVRMIED